MTRRQQFDWHGGALIRPDDRMLLVQHLLLLGRVPQLSLALVAVPRRDEPELLGAEAALERLLPGVGPHVRPKLIALGELAAAVGALQPKFVKNVTSVDVEKALIRIAEVQ